MAGYQIVGIGNPSVSNGTSAPTSGYQIVGVSPTSTTSQNQIPSWESRLISTIPAGQLVGADSAAAPTLIKSAVSSTPDMLSNLTDKLNAGVNDLNNLVYSHLNMSVPKLSTNVQLTPKALQVTPEEEAAHPIANTVGSVIGAAPLALMTEGASLEASPDLAALKNFGAASRLKAIPYGVAQGALQGALYSPKGNTARGTLLGSLIGGGLEGALPAASSVASHAKIDPEALQAQIDASQAESDAVQHQIGQIVPIAENAMQTANDAQAAQLGSLPAGKTFESELGTGIKNGIKAIRDSFKPRYQDIKDGLFGLKVQLPAIGNSQDTNSFVSDLLDSLPSSYADDNGDLLDAIQSVKSQPKSVPATQLIDLWKGARDAANKATAKGNAFGVGADVQNAWRAKAANLNKIASLYRQTMVDELPPETINELNSADADYGQQVMPFYKSPYFSSIQKNGKVPSSFIDKIAGNEPHQIAMQNLIQSNPELNRLALGQKYASDPNGLLTPDSSDIPYIQAHQPTSDLIQKQQTANNNLQQAKILSAKVQASDPLTQGKLASQILDQAHQQKMNDIMNQKTSALQKTAQLQKEMDNYTKNNSKIKKHIRNASIGFGLYGLHYLGWHELMKMFGE